MCLASCLFAFAVVLSPLVLSPAPAAAQQPTTPLACDGTCNIERASEIKSGMMQMFLQAATAQQADRG
jgi:hypothetical protein